MTGTNIKRVSFYLFIYLTDLHCELLHLEIYLHLAAAHNFVVGAILVLGRKRHVFQNFDEMVHRNMLVHILNTLVSLDNLDPDWNILCPLDGCLSKRELGI